MKRLLLGVTILCAAAILAGCPIYSNNTDYRVCNSSGCYDCPDPGYSAACIPWQCNVPADCGPGGYTCSYGSCVALGTSSGPVDASAATCQSSAACAAGYVCGLDNTCHVGTCITWGCASGTECVLIGGAVECLDLTTVSSSGDASVGDGASTAVSDAGATGDAGDGASSSTADGASPGSDGASSDTADASDGASSSNDAGDAGEDAL